MALSPGQIIRQARVGHGLTLAQLGERVGYSTAQLSRFERGVSPLTDVTLLRRFAEVLSIPPAVLGVTAHVASGARMPAATYPRLAPPTVGGVTWREDEDPVRRRAFLAMSASASLGAGLPATGPGEPAEQTLINGLRDAMLGLRSPAPTSTVPASRAMLAQVVEDYHACRYGALSHRLPALIQAGHASNEGDILTQAYLLTTRMLIKLDDQPLGWMAADRAQQLANSRDDGFALAEAARQLAVLARRSGWTDQALAIALGAADDPRLRQAGAVGEAERGLLIQSAAYTAAKAGDRTGMRELTAEAAAVASGINRPLLHDHGSVFTSATVQLHLVSAETCTGDPSAALATARQLAPGRLPTVERRARYWADVATAHAQWGHRDECLEALLTAERLAPEETHGRPAVRALISGLLLSGRTTSDLRALATRSRVSA